MRMIFCLGMLLLSPLLAIEWDDTIVVCPNCKAANNFKKASFGQHSLDQMYYGPSKFHYVFWPHTDKESLYSCLDCGLTLFMMDFYNISQEKLPEIRKILKDIPLPAGYRNYVDIPMYLKLSSAEKIYQTLGKSDELWGEFYRIFAYHLERDSQLAKKKVQEEKTKLDKKEKHSNSHSPALLTFSSLFRPLSKYLLADNALGSMRQAKAQSWKEENDFLKQEAEKNCKRALEQAQKMIADARYTTTRKELLFIAGAMQYHLKNPLKAEENFQKALSLQYSNPIYMNEAQAQGHNQYLNELLNEFLKKIKE